MMGVWTDGVERESEWKKVWWKIIVYRSEK